MQANVGRAATYINRILRAANEGKAAADNPHVVWARQKAAKILFSKNDYQQSLKAERLLRQSTASSLMNSEESELLTDILISRNDPASLRQATELLTEMANANRLSTKGALQLARILSQSDQWDRSKELMLELIAKNPADLQVRTGYVELLINQGEYSDAESRPEAAERYGTRGLSGSSAECPPGCGKGGSGGSGPFAEVAPAKNGRGNDGGSAQHGAAGRGNGDPLW